MFEMSEMLLEHCDTLHGQKSVEYLVNPKKVYHIV